MCWWRCHRVVWMSTVLTIKGEVKTVYCRRRLDDGVGDCHCHMSGRQEQGHLIFLWVDHCAWMHMDSATFQQVSYLACNICGRCRDADFSVTSMHTGDGVNRVNAELQTVAQCRAKRAASLATSPAVLRSQQPTCRTIHRPHRTNEDSE